MVTPNSSIGKLLRSSFRYWAAEEMDHPREVVEAALAHAVQNKVEAAYRRNDLFGELPGTERWEAGSWAAQRSATVPGPACSGELCRLWVW